MNECQAAAAVVTASATTVAAAVAAAAVPHPTVCVHCSNMKFSR